MSALLFETIEFLPTFETRGEHKFMRPYIMTRDRSDHVSPLWIECLGEKPKDGQMDMWEHRLLASMAFGKPMRHQTLQGYENMQSEMYFGNITKRANMIGVYEQAKSGTLPKGNGGRVILHRSGHFYTVSADTQQAAYKFALDVFIRLMASAYKSCGLDPKPFLEELVLGAEISGFKPSEPVDTKTV